MTPSLAASVWQIVRKDWTVEVRSREIAYTTLFFAVSCLLVFAFALVREGQGARRSGRGHPVGDADLCRHAGAGPHLRT